MVFNSLWFLYLIAWWFLNLQGFFNLLFSTFLVFGTLEFFKPFFEVFDLFIRLEIPLVIETVFPYLHNPWQWFLTLSDSRNTTLCMAQFDNSPRLTSLSMSRLKIGGTLWAFSGHPGWEPLSYLGRHSQD